VSCVFLFFSTLFLFCYSLVSVRLRTWHLCMYVCVWGLPPSFLRTFNLSANINLSFQIPIFIIPTPLLPVQNTSLPTALLLNLLFYRSFAFPCWVTCLKTGSRFLARSGISLSWLLWPDRLQDTSSSYLTVPCRQNSRSMQVTTHLHFVPRLIEKARSILQ
jgi:hypothetical protein